MEEKWRDPEEGLCEIFEMGFVEFMFRVTRFILQWAARLASFVVSISRQRLITEFFRPAEAN